MNDKQQLAAMGAEMADRQQPMCMAKRIEELEAQALDIQKKCSTACQQFIISRETSGSE